MDSASKEYACQDGIHRLILADDGQRLYAHLLAGDELVNECCLLATAAAAMPPGDGIAPDRLPLSVLWEFDDSRLEDVFIVCRHGGFRLLAPCCAANPSAKCRSYAEVGC